MTTIQIPASTTTEQELNTALADILGKGNYSIQPTLAKAPDDEELGFEPLITGFIIGVATNVIADLLTELIKKRLSELKKD